MGFGRPQTVGRPHYPVRLHTRLGFKSRGFGSRKMNRALFGHGDRALEDGEVEHRSDLMGG